MKKLLILSLLAMVLVVSSALFAESKRGNFKDNLTKEQQETLKDLRKEMREDGASQEEIREAARAQLGKWGIETPNASSKKPKAAFWSELNEDQAAEMQEMIEKMRKSSQDEVRDAVKAKLDEWGIKSPEKDRNRPPFWDDLNEKQQSELDELIEEMKENESDQKEIRETIHAKLKEWGIELPEKSGKRQEKQKNSNSK